MKSTTKITITSKNERKIWKATVHGPKVLAPKCELTLAKRKTLRAKLVVLSTCDATPGSPALINLDPYWIARQILSLVSALLRYITRKAISALATSTVAMALALILALPPVPSNTKKFTKTLRYLPAKKPVKFFPKNQYRDTDNLHSLHKLPGLELLARSIAAEVCADRCEHTRTFPTRPKQSLPFLPARKLSSSHRQNRNARPHSSTDGPDLSFLFIRWSTLSIDSSRGCISSHGDDDIRASFVVRS